MKERLKIFLRLIMDAVLMYLSLTISIYIINNYYLIDNLEQINSYVPYLIGIKILVFLLFLFYSEEPNRSYISIVLGVISANLISLSYLYYQGAYYSKSIFLYGLIALIDLVFILLFRLTINKIGINSKEITTYFNRIKNKNKKITTSSIQIKKSSKLLNNKNNDLYTKEKKLNSYNIDNETIDFNTLDSPSKEMINETLKISSQNSFVEKEKEILKRIKDIEKKEDIIEKTITNLEQISKNIKHRIKVLEDKENSINEKMKFIEEKEKEYREYILDKKLYDTIFNAPDTFEDEIKMKDHSKEIIIDKNDLLEIRNMIEQASE